jgi:hypothetical protein
MAAQALDDDSAGQRHRQHQRGRSPRSVCFFLFCSIFIARPCRVVAQRIAVIGGGISGTFVSKYLVDQDLNCSLEGLVIYDPLPIGQLFVVTQEPAKINDAWQSSRVATVEVDGQIVELGQESSLVPSEFLLVREMATTGGLLLQQAPRQSISLYNGNGDWVMHTQAPSDDNDDAINANYWNLLWRYNTDYYKISRVTKRVTDGMHKLHDMLQDNQHYFFDSPEQMYQAVRLWPMVMHSLDNVADALGVTKDDNNDLLRWWRHWYLYLLPHQGSLRQEVLTAMSLVYYHQDASRINGISGLLAWHYYFATTTSGSGSAASLIVGGNAQLLSTAFSQAQTNQKTKCSSADNNHKPNTNNVVSHVQQRISTVVGSVQGFELYAHNGDLMGEYDVVILAAPLHTAGIDFLIKSHMDEAVLQSMPLGGLVKHTNIDNEEDTTIPKDHEGHVVLPPRLPGTVTRPYIQVVVTIVRQARLQTDYFSLNNNNKTSSSNNATSIIPDEIYMTAKGMKAEHNVTAIFQLSSNDNDNDGMLYKVYSSEPLKIEIFQTFFGERVQVAFQKVWGGKHGGMVPDYQGQGQTTDFLLYDGATGLHGHTNSGALYFPNALEASFFNMETCAMGAKAVAKLIAKRMEWIPTDSEDSSQGEEL